MKKLMGWGVVAVLYLFVLCHISALVGEVGYLGALYGFINHIVEKPFDVLYFDSMVYGLGWLCFLAAFFLSFFKVEKPKAEMKGKEHGDSHFQSEEEIKRFLKVYTTPILPLEGKEDKDDS